MFVLESLPIFWRVVYVIRKSVDFIHNFADSQQLKYLIILDDMETIGFKVLNAWKHYQVWKRWISSHPDVRFLKT